MHCGSGREWRERMKIPELETERLILRRHEEKDFADMREYLSDEKAVAFEPYLPMSDDEVRECLRERMGSDEFIAVEEKASGKMIGNLYVGERFCDSVEIGYVLNRSFWRKGYATEACRKVMEFVFSQGKHRLEAECDPKNEASWRLLGRLGFQREGFLQKNVYFRTDNAGNPIWKDSFLYAKRQDTEALPERIQKLETQMWEAARARDKKTFLELVSGSAVMVCGGSRCTGAEYAEIIARFDCKEYVIQNFEVTASAPGLVQVHYTIILTVSDPANADLAGTFHITTTWQQNGEGYQVIFNMDQRVS